MRQNRRLNEKVGQNSAWGAPQTVKLFDRIIGLIGAVIFPAWAVNMLTVFDIMNIPMVPAWFYEFQLSLSVAFAALFLVILVRSLQDLRSNEDYY